MKAESATGGSAVNRFSIVIPTYNRLSRLVDALESAALQEYPRDMFEVIVVNDGSTDGTRDFIDAYARGHMDLGMKAVNLEAHSGAARARNAGIMESKGEIVAFMDDDCVAERNWLSALDRAFRSSPDSASVVVRLENACPDSMLARYQYVHHVFGIRNAYIPGSLGSALNGSCFVLPASDCQVRGSACQVSFRRRVFEEAGLYDEDLTLSEDIEYILRLEGRGYQRPQYASTATVKHYYSTSIAGIIRKYYLYGRGGPMFRRLRGLHSHRKSGIYGPLLNICYFALECWHARRGVFDLPPLILIALAAQCSEYIGEACEAAASALPMRTIEGGRRRQPRGRHSP